MNISGLIAALIIVPAVGLFGLSLAGLVIGLESLALVEAFSTPYLWRAWRFTLLQATLSTLLSLLIALPVAFAFARRRFWGRTLLAQFAILSFVLPPIVVAFGLLELLGRNGWLASFTKLFDVNFGSWIFGLDGILIAHVFFNAPLAVRYLLAALDGIPAQTWRVSAQLDLGAGQRWQVIDWPALRGPIANAATLIFLLCFTSFALVLALGGGPRSNTLEVAIYEALAFDVDIAKASALALLQLGTLTVVVALFAFVAKDAPLFPQLSNETSQRPDRLHKGLKLIDGLVLLLFTLAVALPLLAILLDGVSLALLEQLTDSGVQRAWITSIWTASLSALLAVILAVAVVRLGRFATLASYGLLLFPGFLFVTGLFVITRQVTNPMTLGPTFLVLVNLLMALPFAVRSIESKQREIAGRYNRLSLSLGLAGPRRWLLVEFPLLRPSLGLAFGLSAALALGDFGVIAFFGSQNFATLPLVLSQGLASYRFEAGGALSLLILFSALALFLLGQLLGGSLGRIPRDA